MMIKTRVFLALAAAAVATHLGTTWAQEASEPGQDRAWHNQQSLALAELAASGEWYALPGGALWRRVAGDGSGAHPTVDDVVTVHYAGTFIDGREFDSSTGRPPATFPLRGLIPAWQLAIPHAGIGDTIEIAAPAHLAYGPAGGGPIPGGATLLFKVELLGIAGR